MCIRDSAYPHVFSYHDGRRLHTFPTLGIQVVIECCKHNLMTDQSAVAYGYAALVLKTASGIYEHVFPTVMFLPQSV